MRGPSSPAGCPVRYRVPKRVRQLRRLSSQSAQSLTALSPRNPESRMLPWAVSKAARSPSAARFVEYVPAPKLIRGLKVRLACVFELSEGGRQRQVPSGGESKSLSDGLRNRFQCPGANERRKRTEIEQKQRITKPIDNPQPRSGPDPHTARRTLIPSASSGLILPTHIASFPWYIRSFTRNCTSRSGKLIPARYNRKLTFLSVASTCRGNTSRSTGSAGMGGKYPMI